MAADLILNNSFFGFWYVLGNHFFAIFAMAIFIAVVLGLAFLLARR